MPDIRQEAHDLADAAETGAAARALKEAEEEAETLAEKLKQKGVSETAEEAAQTLRDSVERSVKLGEETYQEERAKGTGAIQAAGDAYSAVDDAAEKSN